MRGFLCLLYLVPGICCFGQDEWKNLFSKEFFSGTSLTLPYRYYSPSVSDSGKYPLIVFLHGAGERGTDNEIQLLHGVKIFMNDSIRNKYNFFMIVPQCPEGARWVETSWKAASHIMPEVPALPIKTVFELLDSLIEVLPIDTNRLYVTGLSMGGFGTWDAICRRPEFFAAAIPVCGGGDENQAAQATEVPIWAFHGEKDELVLPSRTKNMVAAINKAGGNAKITLFPDLGHFCWQQTYSYSGVMEWFFSNSKTNR